MESELTALYTLASREYRCENAASSAALAGGDGPELPSEFGAAFAGVVVSRSSKWNKTAGPLVHTRTHRTNMPVACDAAPAIWTAVSSAERRL